MEPARQLMTAEDLYSMPDDDVRHELQAGVLISEPLPGARHGRVAVELARILANFVREYRLGVVIGNDSGFVLARRPDTVRGPDVSFVVAERYKAVGDPKGPFPGAPDLAVEVLSPSNSPAAIHAKVADYLAAGTRLVWVVDPETRTVSVHGPLLSPRRLAEADVLDGGDVLPGLEIRVGELFEI